MPKRHIWGDVVGPPSSLCSFCACGHCRLSTRPLRRQRVSADSTPPEHTPLCADRCSALFPLLLKPFLASKDTWNSLPVPSLYSKALGLLLCFPLHRIYPSDLSSLTSHLFPHHLHVAVILPGGSQNRPHSFHHWAFALAIPSASAIPSAIPSEFAPLYHDRVLPSPQVPI